MAGLVSLDVGRLEAQIMRGALHGLDLAARATLRRAQSKAPVRKLFAGTTYHHRAGFREPVVRQVRFRSTQAEALTGESRTSAFEVRRGHSNSLEPLIRVRGAGQDRYLSGDFRRVGEARIRNGRTEQRLAQVPTEGFIKQGGQVRHVEQPRTRAEDIRLAGGKSLVTSRGRFEIRTGRANFTGADKVTRVGGRLKGELHTTGPTNVRGGVRMYVRSATKDPDTGVLYPYYQEFGSRHNRPHPFLRPALQETRSEFRKLVRNGVKEAVRSR